MLHRRLERYWSEQRPVWIFLADQQRWIEEAQIVAIEGDLVTFQYDEQDDGDCHTWEESVRMGSIGAVSTRLASLSRNQTAEDLPVTGDCPDVERLSQPES